MIHIAEPVTLDKLLPLIQKLSEGERERLRDALTKEAAVGAAGMRDALDADTLPPEVRREFAAILAEVQDEPGMAHEVLRHALDTASRLDAAILFYQKGAVTFGRAAELAGMHRFELDEVFAERDLWKIVEVGPAAASKARIAHIKRLRELDRSTRQLKF